MFTKSLKRPCMMFLLGLSACGVAEVNSADVLDVQSDPTLRSSESNVIMGELDWVDVTSLSTNSPERTRSKAVGILQYNFRPDGDTTKYSRCTAWLASKDVVITNGHCIDTPAEAADARVSFNFEKNAGSAIWYDCSLFIQSWGDGHDDHEDTTALRCKPRNGVYPGELYGYLKVSTKEVAQDAAIYVIHQNCDESSEGEKCPATKKYSPGKVLGTGDSTHWMSHDADTLGGSSGGPMLSKSSHEVVGMNRGNASSGDKFVNTAVRGSLIREHLREIGL